MSKLMKLQANGVTGHLGYDDNNAPSYRGNTPKLKCMVGLSKADQDTFVAQAAQDFERAKNLVLTLESQGRRFSDYLREQERSIQSHFVPAPQLWTNIGDDPVQITVNTPSVPAAPAIDVNKDHRFIPMERLWNNIE